MRTYKRKKPEYKEIEGVQDLCRLCLGKAEAGIPIFTEETDDAVCGTLPLRIMICVGLEITREDYVPNAICMECSKELERFYVFRKKCEMVDQKLKLHIHAVKEKVCQQAAAKELELRQNKQKEDPNGEHVQHLILTFNNEQQVELVNVVNLDSVQLNDLSNLEILNNRINANVDEVGIEEQLNNKVQMQDISTTNPSPSTLEPEAESSNTEVDVSLILSTILTELGVLRPHGEHLALADDTLHTVELEGDGGTRIVLELCEEDEEQEAQKVEPEEEAIPNKTEVVVISKESNPPAGEVVPQPKFVIKDNIDKSKGARALRPECALCGKRFVSRSVLARHARVHSGERPYACPVCQRRFAQREVMARHQLVHDARRPFQCARCHKSFTQRGALAAHARAHAPPAARALALHACPHCAKVFLHASGLSRHILTHSGRVFPCADCGRSFNDSSSLVRHRRNTHRAAATPAAPAAPAAPAPDA